MPTHTRIIGTGSYLPRRVESNGDLAGRIDTSDVWIRSMTGIHQRHIASDEETTVEMGAQASALALKAAAMAPSQLDLIVVATITGDLIFPSTACSLQTRLGARNVGAFDVSAACSGFLYALSVVDGLIASGRINTALIVGSERMSRLLDWQDRSTCVLFGDGAGAAVVIGDQGPGLRSIHLHSDASTPEVLRAPARTGPFIHMEGPAVFKFAVRGMVDAGRECLEANSMSGDVVDWLIPHQANLRIIEASAKKLGIARDKIIVTVDRHANTSAASIPLALDLGIRDHRIVAGNELLLISVGGGFTWASASLRWT